MFEKSFLQPARFNLRYILPSFSCRKARYAALIQAKSPQIGDAHLAESIFQTRSRRSRLYSWLLFLLYRKVRFLANH
ncbi:MAG: DUF6783 domain-containing protein [Anaerobutyricum hallii]